MHNNPFRFFSFKLLFVLLAFTGMVACKETASGINMPLGEDFASRTSKNAVISFKDSGLLKFVLRAPIIEEFETIDSPYTLFRKGMDMDFFEDKPLDKPGRVIADWARHDKLKGLFHARGHVILVNQENDSLKTDTLFWDQKQKRVYTRDTVEIIRSDGSYLMSRFGLEASEDFKTYTLYNNKGNFYFENKEL